VKIQEKKQIMTQKYNTLDL